LREQVVDAILTETDNTLSVMKSGAEMIKGQSRPASAYLVSGLFFGLEPIRCH
jgi:hypothetical protein